MSNIFNISSRKVGGIRFLKIGRFCFSFCLTQEYKAFAPQKNEPMRFTGHDADGLACYVDA